MVELEALLRIPGSDTQLFSGAADGPSPAQTVTGVVPTAVSVLASLVVGRHKSMLGDWSGGVHRMQTAISSVSPALQSVLMWIRLAQTCWASPHRAEHLDIVRRYCYIHRLS